MTDNMSIGNLSMLRLFGEPSLEVRKQFSAIRKEAEKIARSSHCVLCGNELLKPCNSHSVPRFVLKNISSSGHVKTINSSLELPLLHREKDVGNFEIFKTICSSCDSAYFKDYENPESWRIPPTGVMLAEIALKDSYDPNLLTRQHSIPSS